MSTRDSPNIPRKCSRYSQEGRTRTPSSTKTLSEQHQSCQRRFSNKCVNRSIAEPAQASAMDATFLDRLYIDTPTLENVGNTFGQENISGIFFLICLFFLYFFVFKFM